MIVKEAAETVQEGFKAMQSVPLAIALLLVNLAFLAFASYVLGRVAENASERNKTQMEVITGLVHELKECATRDRSS
jgi:flagellar biogenesis protein FliO